MRTRILLPRAAPASGRQHCRRRRVATAHLAAWVALAWIATAAGTSTPARAEPPERPVPLAPTPHAAKNAKPEPHSRPASRPSSRPAGEPSSSASSSSKPTVSAEPRMRIKLTGVNLLSKKAVRTAAGAPPAQPMQRRVWLIGASGRVEALYKSKGYTHARVWGRLAGKDKSRPELHVDEGRVLLVIHGVGTLQQLLYRVDLFLPKRVFHKPTIDAGVAEIRKKYKLAGAYYRIAYERPMIPGAFGALVPTRALHIYALSHERFGWRFKASLSSTWGILPEVAVDSKSLFFNDDRAHAELAIAFPYRRFLWEQDPQFQWVHSRLNLGYRLPPLVKNLAPKLVSVTAVSRYARSDIDLREYFTFRTTGLAEIVLLFPPIATLELGGGITHTRIFDVEQNPEPRGPPPSDEPLTRYVGRAELRFKLDRALRRRDQRNELSLSVKVAVSSDGDAIADARFRAQVVRYFAQHSVILRARGVFLHGDVRFWDEEPLAGDYQRAFFDNRYWVHEALQFSFELRLFISNSLSLGVYHNLSGFFDRTTDNNLTAANAFGPSIHLLLFDLFSFDIYYAFGFAPSGFDHNLALQLQTIF